MICIYSSFSLYGVQTETALNIYEVRTKYLCSDAEAHATSRSTRSSGQGQRTDLPVSQQHPCNNHPRSTMTTTATTTTVTQTTTQGLAQKLNCKIHNIVCNKKRINADRQKEFLFRAFPVRPAGQGGKEGSTGGSPGHCFRWNVSRVFRSRVRSIQYDYEYGVYRVYIDIYIYCIYIYI